MVTVEKTMISVQQADAILAARCKPHLRSEKVPIMRAQGRILAEDLIADRPFPPFNRVMMDGIALAHAVWAQGQKRFRIEDMQAAGQPQKSLNKPEHCLEVCTGAVLPAGCDTVIPYEHLKIEGHFAEILAENVVFQQNIHALGSDKAQGAILLEKGAELRAPHLATAATIGKSDIEVVRLPRIALVSTGDELVSIEEVPEAHQIRRSNVYAMAAILKQTFQLEAEIFHFPDQKTQLKESVKKLLTTFDGLIFSGAVSAGAFDFLPEVFAELGIQTHFHQVAQRPGKPLFFGSFDDDRVPVFGLPGNPVSTFLCMQRYVVPFFNQYLGIKKPLLTARLSGDFTFKPPLSYFLPIAVESRDGILWATPCAGNGSGDLANLNQADAFLELPADTSFFKKGESFKIYRF
jgi:molybdopterin molybdotransferase